jgi:hypothetical protein
MGFSGWNVGTDGNVARAANGTFFNRTLTVYTGITVVAPRPSTSDRTITSIIEVASCTTKKSILSFSSDQISSCRR